MLRERTLFLVGNVDSKDFHRVARKCAGTGGRCKVTVQKLFIQKLPRHAQSFHFHATIPTLHVSLSRLPWVSP